MITSAAIISLIILAAGIWLGLYEIWSMNLFNRILTRGFGSLGSE
ncbi:hypothetical protein [Alteribacter natronophilus]|nr:hypothetical protein [Alteribacter natronophilus]